MKEGKVHSASSTTVALPVSSPSSPEQAAGRNKFTKTNSVANGGADEEATGQTSGGQVANRKTRKRGRSLRKAALLNPATRPAHLLLDESDDEEADAVQSRDMVHRKTFAKHHESHVGTVRWGYCVLAVTWLVFVLGMGTISGVWSWAFGDAAPHDADWEDWEGGVPIEEYYPCLAILTGGVMAWIWVIAAWIGLKYFRHSAPVGNSN